MYVVDVLEVVLMFWAYQREKFVVVLCRNPILNIVKCGPSDQQIEIAWWRRDGCSFLMGVGSFNRGSGILIVQCELGEAFRGYGSIMDGCSLSRCHMINFLTRHSQLSWCKFIWLINAIRSIATTQQRVVFPRRGVFHQRSFCILCFDCIMAFMWWSWYLICWLMHYMS